jgi:hypothetical protein
MESVGINLTLSATQLPPPEEDITPLTVQAMHQDELTYRPTDSIDGLFCNAAIIIQQGHVRLVLRLHPAPQADFLQCRAKMPMQGQQSHHTIAAAQYEWLVA